MPEPLERRTLKTILIVLACIAVAAILLYVTASPPETPP
jgi:preprotein translocase subunit SecE